MGKAGTRGPRGKTGTIQTRFDRYALAIVVVATAVSAIYFSTEAQHRLNEAASSRTALEQTSTHFAAQIDCQQQVFEQTVIALKARSTFAEIQARTILNLDRAQQRYLNTTRGATPEEVLAARDQYQKALVFSIRATHDQLEIRSRHPYPTVARVQSCR